MQEIESFATGAGKDCMNHIEGLESCRGPRTWSETYSSASDPSVLGGSGWSCSKSENSIWEVVGDIEDLDSGAEEDLDFATSFAYHYRNWLHISPDPEILSYKN